MDLRKKILLVLCVIAVPLVGNAALECYHFRRASQLRDLGHVAEAQGRVSEGIAYYEQSLRAYPELLEVYSELAELYETKKDLKQAEHYWTLALEKAPPDPRSQSLMHRMRGTFYYHHQMLAQAEPDLAQASSLNPSDGLSLSLLTACRKKVRLTVPSPVESGTSH